MLGKKLKSIISLFFIPLLVLTPALLLTMSPVYAATTPALGNTANFGILSSTYTNTAGGTTINGDLGYTTGPAVAPTVSGTTYISPASKYSTAGTDQGTVLTNLNNQPCTSLGVGAVNLDNVAGHTDGVYTPGCYSSGGAMDITVGATVTLNGAGTYIFKPDGALTTAANTVIALTNGASACDVFWVPTAATTLGANSTFKGTDIDASGITIGSTVNWVGRALAFGGTVSTATDTISVPSCTGATNAAGGSTSTSSSSSSSTSNSSVFAPAAKVCPNFNCVTPLIIEAKRIDPNSIFLSWGPYGGTDKFVIQYGLENGKWLYSANVTGFSTTINSLPQNQPIWVLISPTDNCSIGLCGEAKLIGGPLLPNVGNGPKNYTPWYASAGIFVLLSFLLKLTHN